MKLTIILLVIFSFSSLANDYQIHVLKEGETISELLYSKKYFPIYGKDMWLDKTLQMNHLANEKANKIKKGFPIILPFRGAIASTQKKQPNKAYVNNLRRTYSKNYRTISEHQDVYFSFGYAQTSIKLPSSELSFPETFSLAMAIQGKNNFRFNNLIYNLNAKLKTTSHGDGHFKNDSDKIVSLNPSYSLTTGIDLQTQNIPFHFGPQITFEEKTLIEENVATTRTLRDNLTWIGFAISDRFKWGKQYIHASTAYDQNITKGLSDKDYNISKFNAEIKLNLTQHFYTGLYTTVTTYEGLDLDQENMVGVNLSYNIK
ncbi:MAG: hypothetical protein HON90_07950 [Halobacteriovoraceae bacterium]|jgi:hypothetical protein|nr:hypothetical protein [Halobacteriovoraceae bacterium]